MADGRDQPPGSTSRPGYSWTEIFRVFQVALDPRKLLLAAVGIVVMSFGWYVLSAAFWYPKPDRNTAEYSNNSLANEFGDRNKPGTNEKYTDVDLKAEGDKRHAADVAQWQVLDDLAGKNGGRLRTLPWYEYRGKNPYLFVTDLLGAPATTWAAAVREYLSTVAPVLLEPLVKLLLPVGKLVSPGVSPQTRLYLLLVIFWTLAVWAFFGGVITRLAAVQLANKGPITLRQAVRYVGGRYRDYLSSPLIPLAIIAAVVVGLILYGVLALVPFLGDIFVLGLGLPVVILAGAVMAVFLVGLVGYPLMYPTLSAEGDASDTFDALSRSVNYVYQAPWNYIWYWLVAIVYGAAVTFFVLFFTSLMVYMGKWAVGLTAAAVYTDRKPDYLFVYTPESFGWRELLLKDSPYAVRGQWVLVKDGREFSHPADAGRAVMYDKAGRETANPAEAVRTAQVDRAGREALDPAAADRQVFRYVPADPDLDARHRDDFWWYNRIGAGIVTFWLTLFFLMMLGFSYSFFWSAATLIYLLMRKKVDEAELDEVFVEEDEPEAPLAPPKVPDATGAGTSLPVITPPAAPPAPPAPPPVVTSPPVATSPPPPPATIPFTGLAAPEPGPAPAAPSEEPRKDTDETGDGEKPTA
jgi:hypothetical protein